MIPLRLLQNQRRRSSSSGWLQPKRALKIFFQHEVNRVHLKLKLVEYALQKEMTFQEPFWSFH